MQCQLYIAFYTSKRDNLSHLKEEKNFLRVQILAKIVVVTKIK